MPEKKTIVAARKAKREGKAPSTQAGAFVHEEIEHIREGKHGARNAKQAIAIGLSKARSAGVKLPPPPGDEQGAREPSRQPLVVRHANAGRPSKKRCVRNRSRARRIAPCLARRTKARENAPRPRVTLPR